MEQPEIGQPQARRVGILPLDVAAHGERSDVVSVAHLELEVAVAPLIEVIVKGQPEVKLLLPESVARLEPGGEFAVGAELIAHAQVEFIGESAVVVVAHVERIEDGVETDVALIVDAEVAFHAVEHVVADDVPQDFAGQIGSAGLGRTAGEGRVAGHAADGHGAVEREGVVVERVRAHAAHQLHVVLVGDGVGQHAGQAVESREAAAHLAADKAEARAQVAAGGQ